MSMDDEKLRESTLESEFIFNGRLLKVYRDRVQLPNGHESQREFIRHQGAVGILPILDDGSMIFVRQFRYPVKRCFMKFRRERLKGTKLLYPAPNGSFPRNQGIRRRTSRN